MNQKKKLGRKVISYVLALVMVFSTFTGIVPGTSLTAKADESYPQTYKIVFTSKGNPSQRTWKEDTTLPQTIAGSTMRSYMRYAAGCDHIDLISGNNVSIDGTNISINGEGTSTVNVYKTSTSYAPFGIVVTKNITAIATGYTGTFDNDEHGVSVDVKVPSSGYTIKYGTQSGTYDLEESPKYENAGNYTVYYQVTADGYNTKTGSVLVSIAKATPTINTQPVASAIYYGQSLADSSLSNGTASVPGTFAWKDNTIQPDVTDSDQTEYEVVFTPEDTANYNTVSCNVKLTVNKADPDVTDPTGLTATYGQILEDVTLPEVTDGTWSFDDPQTSVGNVGTNEFAATYTPTDTTRYKIKHTNLSVTVGEVDKTALDNAISLAETYYNQIKDNTDYTDIVNSLNSAIDAAKAVKNNPNVTSETVAEAVTTMNTAVDDTKAAEAVIAKIIDLPAAEDVKHTDVDAIHEARAAYDKLTDSQKGMINETITQKLKDCEEALINKIATAIENIEKVTRDNKDDVRTLLDSYDKLYDTEKDAVDKKLGRAGTKKISDLEEVLEITEKIYNLADPDNIDLTDEKAITFARTAYEMLTDSRKKMIGSEIVARLEAAEKKLEELKGQDAKALADAKAEAKTELGNYKKDVEFADANARAAEVARGEEVIDDASTIKGVHRALADAKKAIDALKTKAQAEEEANSAAAAQALEDAKATAKTELANYKKDEVYRAAEQTAVRAAKADGREAIDAATAIGEGENPDAGTVAKALKDAKAEIDKIKTAAELDLEDAKATAIAKVNTVDASEYVTDDQNKVTTAKTTAITAINAATAVGDSENPADGTVEKALADFNEAISACKTQKETDEQALADAKAEAKTELGNYKKDVEFADANARAAEVARGEEVIDDASTIKGVQRALADAKKAIDELKTKATADEEDAASALAESKTTAKATLDVYKNANDYRDAQKKELKSEVAIGKQNIDEATSIDAVNDALAAAKGEIDKIKTDAQLKEEEATAAATAEMTAADEAVADAKKVAAADAKAAKDATDKINAIGTVTLDSKAAIEAARAAYDALTADQKKLVSADVVKVLTESEKSYAAAKAAEKEEKSGTKAQAKNANALNAKFKVSQTGKQLNVTWGAVSGAEEYGVFVQYCGKSFPKKATVTAKSGKTKVSIKKLNKKALNLKKNYKVYVVAYRTVNGEKTVVGKTITAHVIGRMNAKYSNPKKVTIKSAKTVNLKVGKTSKIKAKITLVNSKKKSLNNSHGKTFRYSSSDTSVAKVSSNGKITAVGKGTCTVYVYARNGYAAKIKVTVK